MSHRAKASSGSSRRMWPLRSPNTFDDVPHVTIENSTHIDLACAWVRRNDGQLILRISEREERSAAGLIIPKRGESKVRNQC